MIESPHFMQKYPNFSQVMHFLCDLFDASKIEWLKIKCVKE